MRKRYLILALLLFSDAVFALISLAISCMICDNFSVSLEFLNVFPYLAWSATVLIVAYILKIYNILWRFSGFYELLRIIATTVISTFVLFVCQMAVLRTHFSLGIYILNLFITALLIYIVRFFYKHHDEKTRNINKSLSNDIKGNVMIIGAGSAGQMIINEMTRKIEYANCKIRCVIDDDPFKFGQYISGIKIVGGRDSIVSYVDKYNISVIVFAIPNCTVEQKSEILAICQQTSCKLKIVPTICKMYEFSEISHTIREVEIEDLLGRDTIDLGINSSLEYIKQKTVLVTGGGGTIGSELCRQIARHNPKQIIIFDIYENTAYEIQNELKASYPQLDLVVLIGSVRDSKRLDYLFRNYKPDIVYHAAAHKHVPLMESSPNETIKNNVFGTLKTVRAADKYGVEKFVLISTDKAVNPTNIMGASKRICEMIIQASNNHSDTEFVAVRFGNVLGSNGSVIPLFKKQISQGGPVTVTDPNIIRYFMTIPEAVSLVLQAGATANGGEIFVLDMGKPVKILTLAENLIKLSGFTPYKEIPIKFTGLRPGEKLYEELLMSEEGLKATDNDLIYIGRPIDFDEEFLFKTLDEMQSCMYDENCDIRSLVKQIVPTYKIQNNEVFR